MYILINRDEMDLLAKHPNFLALYNLGIINCPDSQEVIPLEAEMFNDYVDSELTMLYIAITAEVPPDNWSRQDLEYILLHLINECKENIIDVNEVCAQAEYCIRWDIEGYCSFVKGKREPSHDEGLWDNLTLDVSTEAAAILITSKPTIEFKRPIQRPFE
jgi:hypothetical protein